MSHGQPGAFYPAKGDRIGMLNTYQIPSNFCENLPFDRTEGILKRNLFGKLTNESQKMNSQASSIGYPQAYNPHIYSV
jgi:hypothetical protein